MVGVGVDGGTEAASIGTDAMMESAILYNAPRGCWQEQETTKNEK